MLKVTEKLRLQENEQSIENMNLINPQPQENADKYSTVQKKVKLIDN